MTQLETSDLKMRSVYSLADSLRKMIRAFWLTMGFGLFFSLCYGLIFTSRATILGVNPVNFLLYFLLGGTILTFGYNYRTAHKIWRRLIVEQPADTILLDLGRALLAALKETGLVSRHLQPDYIRAIEQPDFSYQVMLDYASPEEAQLFASAYQELFEPVRNQRYLILRAETPLPQSHLRRLWLRLRRWAGWRRSCWRSPSSRWRCVRWTCTRNWRRWRDEFELTDAGSEAFCACREGEGPFEGCGGP